MKPGKQLPTSEELALKVFKSKVKVSAALKVGNYISTEELAALGAVVAESAHLEAMIDRMLVEITRLKQAEYDLLVSGAMLGRKVELLRDLGLLKWKSKRKGEAFRAVINQVSEVNGKRATAVHGLWEPVGGMTVEIMTTIILRGLKPSSIPQRQAIHKKRGKVVTLDAEELMGLADAILLAKRDLAQFWRLNWQQPRILRRLQAAPRIASISQPYNAK
jgi:hypothetical protein